MFRSRILGLALVGALLTFSLAAAAPSFFQQEMPEPSSQHKEILQSVGTWQGTLTPFIPGMEPTEIPATETVTAVGGFWVQARFECNFMERLTSAPEVWATTQRPKSISAPGSTACPRNLRS